MHGSEDSASGTVLQRLMQEHLRYGASGPGEPIEGNSSHMPSSPTFTEEDHTAYLYQSVLPQSQPRQEPQGQEHQVDSSSMEKTAGGSQGAGGSGILPGFDTLQLPSYEEAKIQSQLYRGTDLQSQNQGLPVFSTAPDSPTGSHSCPPSLSNAYSLSSSPSLSSLSASLPAVPVKTNAESRPWVQQGGGTSLWDEGLAEMNQGHVRSLNERITQIGLECNGAKQSEGSSGSSSGGDSTHEEESAENSPASTLPPAPTPNWSLEQRGPPPEYPFKFRVHAMLPPTLHANPGSLDYAHLHNDTLTSALPEQHTNAAR